MLTLPKSWCCFGKPPACTRRVRNRHEQTMPITFTGFTMAQNRCDFLASGGKLHCNIFLLYISPFPFRRGIYLLGTSCIRTFASGAAGNQTLWAHCLYCSACSRSAVPKRTLQQGTTLTFAAKGTRAVATKAVVFKSSTCLSSGSLALERIAPSGMSSPCRRHRAVHARHRAGGQGQIKLSRDS